MHSKFFFWSILIMFLSKFMEPFARFEYSSMKYAISLHRNRWIQRCGNPPHLDTTWSNPDRFVEQFRMERISKLTENLSSFKMRLSWEARNFVTIRFHNKQTKIGFRKKILPTFKRFTCGVANSTKFPEVFVLNRCMNFYD